MKSEFSCVCSLYRIQWYKAVSLWGDKPSHSKKKRECGFVDFQNSLLHGCKLYLKLWTLRFQSLSSQWVEQKHEVKFSEEFQKILMKTIPEQISTKAFVDFSAWSRYLRYPYAITSYRISWGVITYPCHWYLPLVLKPSFIWTHQWLRSHAPSCGRRLVLLRCLVFKWVTTVLT